MHFDRLFELVTIFGDQGLVEPFILTVGVMLWIGDAKREAVIWIIATGVALFTILLLKLFFLPCGHLIPHWHVRSPSGHSASSFAAYAGFAVLEARLRQVRWQRVAILACGFLFPLCIAVSRVVVHAHSVQEVMLGSAVGLMAPAILLWKIKSPSHRSLANPLWLAALLPIILLLALQGQVLPIEDHIASFAMRLAHAWGVCSR